MPKLPPYTLLMSLVATSVLAAQTDKPQVEVRLLDQDALVLRCGEPPKGVVADGQVYPGCPVIRGSVCTIYLWSGLAHIQHKFTSCQKVLPTVWN